MRILRAFHTCNGKNGSTTCAAMMTFLCAQAPIPNCNALEEYPRANRKKERNSNKNSAHTLHYFLSRPLYAAALFSCKFSKIICSPINDNAEHISLLHSEAHYEKTRDNITRERDCT